jgi:hypothetical protein
LKHRARGKLGLLSLWRIGVNHLIEIDGGVLA